MANGKMKKILIAVSVVLILVVGAVIVNNYKTKTSFKYRNGEVGSVDQEQQDAVSKASMEGVQNDRSIIKDLKVLEISSSEFVLGEKNAPVAIIEYASLSCPHCASFYQEAFDKLKKEYIETGKVKFVYRDFPLNQPALMGAMVAVCRSQDEEGDKAQTYHNFVKALFKTQDSWAFDPHYVDKIESIAVLDGMTPERFKQCIEDKKLQDKILEARMLSAQSLNINSTPTFFINGEALEGFVDYKTIKKVVDKKLNQE